MVHSETSRMTWTVCFAMTNPYGAQWNFPYDVDGLLRNSPSRKAGTNPCGAQRDFPYGVDGPDFWSGDKSGAQRGAQRDFPYGVDP
jgi:hypothetical protein